MFVYERYLAMAGFQVVPARTTDQARRVLTEMTPSAILLDVMLEGEDTWNFLAELKRDPATRDIPVLVCTVMNRESRARALGADELWLKPVDQDKLVRKLQQLAAPTGAKVLVVDDDTAARYLIAADRRKDEFLAMLAHELRNPLAAVQMGLPILGRFPPRDALEARTLEIVQRQTGLLVQLVNDLLDVSRVTRGRIERAFAAGFDDHIAKPITHAQLRSCLAVVAS